MPRANKVPKPVQIVQAVQPLRFVQAVQTKSFGQRSLRGIVAAIFIGFLKRRSGLVCAFWITSSRAITSICWSKTQAQT
jgi:hypothetical protein